MGIMIREWIPPARYLFAVLLPVIRVSCSRTDRSCWCLSLYKKEGSISSESCQWLDVQLAPLNIMEGSMVPIAGLSVTSSGVTFSPSANPFGCHCTLFPPIAEDDKFEHPKLHMHGINWYLRTNTRTTRNSKPFEP
ncbi:hypothetical protein HDV57DRAFT_118701 [Trichoderma longibrachiatum]